MPTEPLKTSLNLPSEVLVFLNSHHGSFTRPAIQAALDAAEDDATDNGDPDLTPNEIANVLADRLSRFSYTLMDISNQVYRPVEL